VAGVNAQPAEPPCTDPYARWCGRGGAARLPPIPIVLAVWFRAGYSPTDMAHEEPSARTEATHQRSSNKESSLSMRIFFQRHYTDLVRMVGHGVTEAEGREKLQPLIAQY